jgi:protein-L-isoaspartate(D-aspartate) O-methyltransferase
MVDIAAQRRFFADEMEAVGNLQTRALVEALATVPREHFLPPGPWVVRSEADFLGPPRRTADDHPRRVYHNVSIGIDANRQLFNGAPALIATCIERLALRPGDRVLHVGCGLGYYTALMAECVGAAGRVLAIEVDEPLAASARSKLDSWPQVEVRAGDGTTVGADSFDAILVNAGVTHPEPAWLDRLSPTGRVILPLTCAFGPPGPISKGFMIKIARREHEFDASMVTAVAIYSAVGIRSDEINAKLGEVLKKSPFPMFKRLRRDPHDESPACWLHTDVFCLSA